MRAYFDVSVRIGRTAVQSYCPAATASDMIAAMDGAGVSRAVVWHTAQVEIHPHEGNMMTSALISGVPRLTAAWSLLPPLTGEVTRPGFFDEMAAAGVRILRAFPGDHRYLLRRAVMGEFLDEAARRRIPVMMSLERGMTYDSIHQVMSEYPDLTCVVCDVGVWGVDRQVWPLLERYPRLSVEISLVALEAGGIEAGVKRFGAARYLYGSNFPSRYFEAPMLELEHADIDDADKDAIASGNIEALLREVVL